jgi:hypothetical protein
VFEKKSRYYNLETANYETQGGKSSAYKRRRFLPRGEDLPVLTETHLEQSDRLDLIAERTIGDSEQFWRICDANDAMNPNDLLTESGKWLKIPIPQHEENR